MKTILAVLALILMMGGIGMAVEYEYMGDAYPGGINDPAKGLVVLTNDKMKNIEELISAAEGVLPYLSAPSDRMILNSQDLLYRQVPTELEIAENNAKKLKEKDAAIKRFREALRKTKGE